MLHLVTTGWIFLNISRLKYGTTYLYRFSIYHSLIVSKNLVSKHLSDCYPRSLYVVQLGTAHMGNNIPATTLLYLQSQWMDFTNLNGVWKLKRFCITSACIELIFKFCLIEFCFQFEFVFNFYFQIPI